MKDTVCVCKLFWGYISCGYACIFSQISRTNRNNLAERERDSQPKDTRIIFKVRRRKKWEAHTKYDIRISSHFNEHVTLSLAHSLCTLIQFLLFMQSLGRSIDLPFYFCSLSTFINELKFKCITFAQRQWDLCMWFDYLLLVELNAFYYMRLIVGSLRWTHNQETSHAKKKCNMPKYHYWSNNIGLVCNYAVRGRGRTERKTERERENKSISAGHKI